MSMYMHYMGHGDGIAIGDFTCTPLWRSQRRRWKNRRLPGEEGTPPRWVKTVEDSVGRKGTLKGGVLSYGVPRSDTITVGGMTIPPAAGVAEAINFQAADAGNVATTGDFVVTAEEVNPVITELHAHHILVTGAAQPHAHGAAAPILHAFLERRQPGVGWRRNRGSVKTRGHQSTYSSRYSS